LAWIIGDFLHGVEAVYEADSEEMRQTSEIRTVNYESIMTTALSQFEKRDYKATLLTLKRVFKKHPNDVNVAFYSGLSYYNLGKWEKANRQFRRAMAHPQRVFDQEAEWYLALSLQNQEKIAHSQTILKRIVEKEGFYAQKARALLGL